MPRFVRCLTNWIHKVELPHVVQVRPTISTPDSCPQQLRKIRQQRCAILRFCITLLLKLHYILSYSPIGGLYNLIDTDSQCLLTFFYHRHYFVCQSHQFRIKQFNFQFFDFVCHILNLFCKVVTYNYSHILAYNHFSHPTVCSSFILNTIAKLPLVITGKPSSSNTGRRCFNWSKLSSAALMASMYCDISG